MNKLRKFLLSSALLFCLANAQAEDVLTVANVALPQNGEVALEIKASFDTNFTQFQLDIELDEGLSLTLNSNGRPWAELGDKSTDHSITSSIPSASTYRFVCSSMSQETLPSSEVLMRVKIIPDEELEIGTVLNGTVKGILFNEYTGSGNVGHDFDDIPFTITIAEPLDPRILLDETSTTVPEEATGVDIRVKRTIKANDWSTICLPFAMTTAQVKEVFGNDVQLAEFEGTEPEFDNDDVISIQVFFSDVDAIEANHPYIIKVSQDISEFTLDGVDITPDEEEAYIEFDNGKSGSRRVVYSGFYGTYHANTVLDEFMLFLSGNKFWYSAGQTKMKAFRAYFDFLDILSDVENANARISMSFDNQAEGIKETSNLKSQSSNLYDLQGRRVVKPGKGLYIQNGRKVIK